MISGPRWVIFCIFTEFYFPILMKFFDLNFWPKNFDFSNWFFDVLKYGFSWLAHHPESYSAFLVYSIFQFEGHFFPSISDQTISILKIDVLNGSNIVFRDQQITLSHILHFQQIQFSNFKEIFFTSISDQKISILKFDFLMGPNIVFRD